MRLVHNEGQEPKIEVQVERQFKKERFIGSMFIRKGQTCYGYDVAKNVIYPVKFKEEAPVLRSTQEKNPQNLTIRRKLEYKEGHLYVVAINLKNAERKFEKALRSALSQRG